MLKTGREYARSTIADRLTSGRGLDLTFIDTFVTACHRFAKLPGEPDLEPFHQGYHRMLRDEAREVSPQRWIGDHPSLADAYQTRQVAARLSARVQPGRSYVLTGPSGVGKTQIATDLARQSWTDHQVGLVLWVTAATREKIVAAYARAAREIGMTDEREAAAADRFLGSLANRHGPRWLIILDDLQDPADLHGLWPPAGNGNAVVTTRCREAALSGGAREIVPIGLFEPHESAGYLSTKLGPWGLDDADRLAEELGHLPLALAQAAALIHDRSLSCAGYLRRFHGHPLSELEPRRQPDGYPTSLAPALTMSVETADEHDPVGAARPLLEVAAMLSPQGIPAAIFTTRAVRDALEERRGRVTTADDAWDGLCNLELLNLCHFDDDRRTVRVHRLLQRAVREAMSPDQRETAATCAAIAVMEVWSAVERDSHLVDLLRASTEVLVGHTALGQGHAEKAVAYWSGLRPIVEARLGAEHPDTLIIRNNLYWAQGRAGDPAAALAGLRQLLEVRKRVLGDDHPNTLATRHAIARWQHETGDPDGAVELLRGLVTDYERVLGRTHRDTLNTRLLLTGMLGATEPPGVTVAALRRLLLDYQQALGPDRAETLDAELRLAGFLVDAGELDAARTLIANLVTGYRRALGPNHFSTLQVRYYAADMCEDPVEGREAMRELRADVLHLIERGHSELVEIREWIDQQPAADD